MGNSLTDRLRLGFGIPDPKQASLRGPRGPQGPQGPAGSSGSGTGLTQAQVLAKNFLL